MKRTLLTLLSVTLITMLLASGVMVSAASAVTQSGEAKNLASTLPVIDGKLDDIWEESNTYYLDILKVGYDTDVKGYFKILWTSSALYVIIVVPDLTPNHDATDDYKKDTVEVALDLSNARTSTYQNDDQMNLRFYGSGADMLVAKDGNGTVTIDEIEWAMTQNDATGYIYEFALQCEKLGVALSADKMIAIDVQVNDNEEGLGERAACYAWNDDADAVFGDPTYMGEIKLVSATAGPAAVEEPAPVNEPAPAEAPAVVAQAETVTTAPVASAPETLDIGVIIVISAILAAAAFITAKKTKTSE